MPRLNAHSARWCRRFMLAAIPTILLAASLDRGEAEERKFMRLTGKPIETKMSGKVLTDEVHWRDYFRKDGALLSNSMGRKTAGKWQVRGNELCLTEEGIDTCYQVWVAGDEVSLRLEGIETTYDGFVRKYEGP
jgi:hypothetical protein